MVILRRFKFLFIFRDLVVGLVRVWLSSSGYGEWFRLNTMIWFSSSWYGVATFIYVLGDSKQNI